MSIEKNVQTVKNFLAALGRRDKQALRALVGEDLEWIIPGEDWPLAGTYRGHAGLEGLLQKVNETNDHVAQLIGRLSPPNRISNQLGPGNVVRPVGTIRDYLCEWLCPRLDPTLSVSVECERGGPGNPLCIIVKWQMAYHDIVVNSVHGLATKMLGLDPSDIARVIEVP